MTAKPRMTCPTCGRQDVAARTVRPPRVNPGRYGAIPAIRIPVRHKRHILGFGDDGRWEWCPAGEGRR